jgi:uncharacterized protein YjbJ (UPF0337 family)
MIVTRAGTHLRASFKKDTLTGINNRFFRKINYVAFISSPNEDQAMNNDGLLDQWKQNRDRAKALWGRLTDDDLEQAAGKVDVLAGLLQDKYGYTRRRAVKDIDMHLVVNDANIKNHPGPISAK